MEFNNKRLFNVVSGTDLCILYLCGLKKLLKRVIKVP